MIVLLNLGVVVYVSGFAATADGATKIVGGTSVTIEEYPYQLRLSVDDRPVCGASLLSNAIALSAAHCITKKGVYRIRGGTDYRDKGGVVVNVRQIVLHPEYSRDSNDYDIAILRLKTPLEYSNKIQSVKLPKANEKLPVGKIGYVSGWGYKSAYFPIVSDQLRAVQVPVVEMRKCERTYKMFGLTPRMFCAGYRFGGKDACQGDSGGPFVIDGVQYGIVSWGVECGEPRYPGVYTNLIDLREYIKANTGL